MAHVLLWPCGMTQHPDLAEDPGLVPSIHKLAHVFLWPCGMTQHSSLAEDPDGVAIPTKQPTPYYDPVRWLNTLLWQKTQVWLQYSQSGPRLSMTMWDDSTLCCYRRSRFGCCTHNAAHILLMTLARTFVFQGLASVIGKKISTSSILFIARISCFKIYDWIKIHCMCTSYSLFICLDTSHLTPFFSK